MDLTTKILLNKLKNEKGGGGGPTPTGTIQITTNGEHNVTSYAKANVQVPAGNQPATLLQWIESPGGNTANLIDIDMIPIMLQLDGVSFCGIRVEADYQFLGDAGSYSNEIGCGGYDNGKRFTIDYPNNSDYFVFSVGTAITTTIPKDMERHTFIIDTKRKHVIVDDRSANITVSSLNSLESFKVFGRSANGTLGFAGPSKFYGLKIYLVDYYNKQYLMQDIVPAKDSNGDIALYDKVNNKYYKSQSTPLTLIAGPVA